MLSVLLPSRGRPEMCRRAVESAKNTAKGDVEILVYLDEDDPTVPEYRKFLYGSETVIDKPRRSGEAIRELYKYTPDRGPIDPMQLFYFGSDDITWETNGWDSIFKEKMPEHGLAVLYPKMGDSCNPCFTRKWVETVGLFPDYFKHFGPDTWYADIAKRAGVLIHVPEVRMAHNRVQDGTYYRTRADSDATFARMMLDETQDERQRLSEKITFLLSSKE